MLWKYTTASIPHRQRGLFAFPDEPLIVLFRNVHVRIYLHRGEDAGERSSEQQEDRNGRQLARVSVSEVGGCLDQLREKPMVNIFSSGLC